MSKALQRNGIEHHLTHYIRQAGTTAIVPEEMAERVERVEIKPPAENWAEPLMKGEVKTLVMSDTHVPLQDEWAIREMLKRDGDADQIVWDGDIFDIDQINSFGQSRDGVLRNEYGTVLAYLMELNLMFKRVYELGGNHEFRITKYLRQRVNPALHFRFTDILEDLANGIQFGDTTGRPTGQVDLPNVFYRGGPHYWWLQVGDCVIAHPRSFSRVPNRTAFSVFEYFEQRIEGLRTVIIGHTHFLRSLLVQERAGPPWYGVIEKKSAQMTEDDLVGRKWNWRGQDFDMLAIECGCLCKEMNYTSEGKISYRQKRDVGYAVLYQVDGVTDFERTEFKILKAGD